MRGSPRPSIRPVALGVVRRDDDLLLIEGYDSVKDERFYRFVGGGIEFGEPAATAVAREFEEELEVAAEPTRLLGVVENIFTYEGELGHEILFLFEVEFSNPDSYNRAEWIVRDSHGIVAAWRPMESLNGGPPLYPAEALGLIQSRGRSPEPPTEAAS